MNIRRDSEIRESEPDVTNYATSHSHGAPAISPSAAINQRTCDEAISRQSFLGTQHSLKAPRFGCYYTETSRKADLRQIGRLLHV